MGLIYKHTSPSGRAYVGQTTRTMEERWQQHIWAAQRGSNTAIHRAIRKYGADAFTHEILYDGIDDQDELNRLEADEIELCNTLSPDGYNLTSGGGICECSLEVRNKIAANNRKSSSNSEIRMRRSEGIKAAMRRPETKKKQSEAIRKALSSAEVRAKISSGVKAARERPEVKAKYTKAHSCPVYKAKASESSRRARHRRNANIFIEGRVFGSQKAAYQALGLSEWAVQYRIHSKSERFRHWYTIPNHNDPECDAVEECWAILQFAKACPNHENIPDWARLRKQSHPTHCDVPDDFWT